MLKPIQFYIGIMLTFRAEHLMTTRALNFGTKALYYVCEMAKARAYMCTLPLERVPTLVSPRSLSKIFGMMCFECAIGASSFGATMSPHSYPC